MATRDPLTQAQDDFAAGNYHRARALRGVSLDQQDEQRAAQARRILAATSPDSVELGILLACLLLLGAVCYYYFSR